MLDLKDGRTWANIIKDGLNMKPQYTTPKLVQTMIDESIIKARNNGY